MIWERNLTFFCAVGKLDEVPVMFYEVLWYFFLPLQNVRDLVNMDIVVYNFEAVFL
jgi:hypothetical protein